MSLQAPDTEEFIEALPYRWSRSLLWAFLVLILAAGAWAATSRVDVSVSGQGMLVPADPMPWVLSPNTGQVEGVRVRPGDHVAPGQTVLQVGQESLSLPQPGYVMAIRSVAGSQVSQGEPLVEWCPDTAQFAFEALVANRDVGRVSLGQTAFIHLDAFPVEQFGSIPAQVVSLQPALETVDHSFRVLLRLGRQSEVDFHKQARKLFPGLTGEAEMVTGQQTLLEMILRPR